MRNQSKTTREIVLTSRAWPRTLFTLVGVAAAGSLAVGLAAAPASAATAPPVPNVLWTSGILTHSGYVQRHIVARLPSASPEATQGVVSALAGLACKKYAPQAAPQSCAATLSAGARWSAPVALAKAKENGSCLRARYLIPTADDMKLVGFYEEHNPKFCRYNVQGLIGEKWMEKGSGRGFLGWATTDEVATPNKFGRFNHFQGGSIYWSPGTGAHEVHGAIKDKWASMGWENSYLGFPVTDETPTPMKVGRFNHFQGGSIYWSPGTGAHEVRGAIRERWAALGWENSRLGFPTSDEHDIAGGGRRSTFENGCRIDWFPTSGATAICNQIQTF